MAGTPPPTTSRSMRPRPILSTTAQPVKDLTILATALGSSNSILKPRKVWRASRSYAVTATAALTSPVTAHRSPRVGDAGASIIPCFMPRFVRDPERPQILASPPRPIDYPIYDWAGCIADDDGHTQDVSGRCGQVQAMINPCSEATLLTLRLARHFGGIPELRSLNITGVAWALLDSSVLWTRYPTFWCCSSPPDRCLRPHHISIRTPGTQWSKSLK